MLVCQQKKWNQVIRELSVFALQLRDEYWQNLYYIRQAFVVWKKNLKKHIYANVLVLEWCCLDWSSAGTEIKRKSSRAAEGHRNSSVLHKMMSSSAGHTFGFVPRRAEVSHFASLDLRSECLMFFIEEWLACRKSRCILHSAFTFNGMQMSVFQVVRWLLWQSWPLPSDPLLVSRYV